MKTISKDSAVFLKYTLKDKEGEVIDQSPSEHPLGYLHGHNNIIPGLERQLEGRKVGEQLVAVVEAEDAYGEYQEGAVQAIPKEHFSGIEKLTLGMQLQLQMDEQKVLATVKEITDSQVTVDSNHPLAGERLTFEVDIVEVRLATDDEIAHGHIHGKGGVHH